MTRKECLSAAENSDRRRCHHGPEALAEQEEEQQQQEDEQDEQHVAEEEEEEGEEEEAEDGGEEEVQRRPKRMSRRERMSAVSHDSLTEIEVEHVVQRRNTVFEFHHADTPEVEVDLSVFYHHGIDPAKVPWWSSKRFQLAILCSVGFGMMEAQRTNLSIAMVCMVKPELNNASSRNASEAKCPEPPSYEDMGEFYWSKQMQGYILGALFWGYMIMQIPGGYLAEKVGAATVIFWSMLPASIGTLLSPLSARAHPVVFMVMRLVIGMGEAPLYPAVQTLWSHWAPPRERSRLVGISFCGGQLANALILPVGGYLCESGFDRGWGSIFYVSGAVGFLWVIIWGIFAYDRPGLHPTIPKLEHHYITIALAPLTHQGKHVDPPWGKFFRSTALWAIIVAHVCGNYGIYMMLTQIPTYMSEVLKFDIKANGLFSMLPYLFLWFFIFVSGLGADFIMERDLLSLTNVRKLFSCVGLLVPSACFVAISFARCDRPMTAVALLCGALGISGMSFSGHFVNHGDIAPRFAGTLFGITNCLATFPGIAAPYVVGALTPNGSAEEWQTVFLVAASVLTVGAAFYAIFATADRQPWAKEQPKNVETPAATTTSEGAEFSRRRTSPI